MSDPRPDLADIVSGDLDAAGRAAAERRMASDPAFRAEVERLKAIGDALGELPAEAWGDLEAPAFELPVEPAPSRSGSRWSAGRSLVAVAAALAIALMAFGLGRITSGDDAGGSGRVVDLPALGGSSGAGAVEISADGARLMVSLSDLAPSEAGEFYELWLLNSPDDLISVGAIRVPESGEVMVTLPVPLPPERYQFLDLSLERADGDPTHSGRSVLRGPTA